jgi:hypothetical protein
MPYRFDRVSLVRFDTSSIASGLPYFGIGSFGFSHCRYKTEVLSNRVQVFQAIAQYIGLTPYADLLPLVLRYIGCFVQLPSNGVGIVRVCSCIFCLFGKVKTIFESSKLFQIKKPFTKKYERFLF